MHRNQLWMYNKYKYYNNSLEDYEEKWKIINGDDDIINTADDLLSESLCKLICDAHNLTHMEA